MEIIIVSPESRRRDNLVSMLESVVSPALIKMVKECKDVVTIANPADPAVVFIDYRQPEMYSQKVISDLILNSAINYVVFLVSRTSQGSHFTHYSNCELIYDEISVEILRNLLNTVQLKVFA